MVLCGGLADSRAKEHEMTSAIDRSGLAATPAAFTPQSSPADVAQAALGRIGDRVLDWSAHVFGGTSSADPARLARGGDVYGLRETAGHAAAALGATPAQEGTLLRALEDFARAAALNVNALAGADADVQQAGLAAALSGGDPVQDIDGVIARIEQATDRLQTANA
jgi:hypothetical protein